MRKDLAQLLEASITHVKYSYQKMCDGQSVLWSVNLLVQNLTSHVNSINNPYDALTWENMTTIKTRILRIWDSAATGVRLCCIKFAQKVVLVQTAGQEGDPRVCIWSLH